MQPEIKEQNTEKKPIPPIQQWDNLAFQVIYQELAPKGFNRGDQYVRVNKKSVVKTQKIAAQLLRGFRERVKKDIDEAIKTQKDVLTTTVQSLSKCLFIQFRKKAILKRDANRCHAIIWGLEVAKVHLETTGIK